MAKLSPSSVHWLFGELLQKITTFLAMKTLQHTGINLSILLSARACFCLGMSQRNRNAKANVPFTLSNVLLFNAEDTGTYFKITF